MVYGDWRTQFQDVRFTTNVFNVGKSFPGRESWKITSMPCTVICDLFPVGSVVRSLAFLIVDQDMKMADASMTSIFELTIFLITILFWYDDVTWCCDDVAWCCNDVTWCCGDLSYLVY